MRKIILNRSTLVTRRHIFLRIPTYYFATSHYEFIISMVG